MFMKMPPLFSWLAGVSMTVFGISAWAARLPAALAAMGTAGAIFWLARREYDLNSAILAGAIYLTIPYVYGGSHSGRQATVDTLFVLLGTLFVAATWYGFQQDYRRGRILAGVLGGLLLLTKGLGAGVYAFVVLPVVLYNYNHLLDREFLLGSGIGIGAVVAWLVPLSRRLGWETVWDEIVIYQVVNRVSGNLNVYDGLLPFMKFPYLATAPTYLGQWIFVLPAAVVVSVWYLGDSREVDWFNAFLAWWGAFVFIFFLVTGNHPHYLMPAYVPAAMILGNTLAASLRGVRAAWVAISGGLGFALLLAPRSVSPISLPASRLWGHEPGAGLLFVAVLISVIGVIYTAQRTTFSFDQQYATAIAMSILLVTTLAAPTLITGDPFESRQQFANDVSEEVENGPVYVVIEDGVSQHWRFLTVEFYLDTSVVPERVEAVNDAPPESHVIWFGNGRPGDGSVLVNRTTGNTRMILLEKTSFESSDTTERRERYIGSI